jgi:hypothetical protein
VKNTGRPGRRVIAGITALLDAILAVFLSIATLAVSEKVWIAPVFLFFFGTAALAAAVHAEPRIAVRWPVLAVRPGSLKAVAVFMIASLHWMVCLGAIAGLFMADTLWVSVPMFFGTLSALLSISILFAASGYFLYSLERVTDGKGGG